MNFLNKLAISITSILAAKDSPIYGEGFGWVDDLIAFMKRILVPILGVACAAGCIYAIVIGVQMARADSGEKREEAKKRLISVIVAIAVVAFLILFFLLIFPEIMNVVLDAGKDAPPISTATGT